MKLSIVIRTLNEGKYLPSLIEAIREQNCDGLCSYGNLEIVVVDSGSTDETVSIAKNNGCKVIFISQDEFSFGRSLNVGCSEASGEIFIFISGHCIPTSNLWLRHLCKPIIDGQVDYCYGRQIGAITTRFSESRIFEKYFPRESMLPQNSYFCNNANSAIARLVWESKRFDEDLTGLEDMELAKRIQSEGGVIGYSAEAEVIHYHHESWSQVYKRFKREAIALQKIMPQLQISFFDMVRYMSNGIVRDIFNLGFRNVRFKTLLDIILYRYFQYLGSYSGNHEHRKLSRYEKNQYFFPK